MILRSMVAVVLVLTSTLIARADDLLSVTVEQTSQAKTPDEASREITTKAMAQTAREQVIDMIGETKFQKNQKVIEAKIIKEASRFIPFVNPRQPVATADGYKMTVDLQVSQTSLRSMVLAAGLLADSETPGVLLSLVTVTDKGTAQTYKWWSGDTDEAKKFLSGLSTDWSDALQSELTKKGFKLATTAKLTALNATTDEKSLLQSIPAQMVIRGEVRVRESTDAKAGLLAMKVGVYQTRDNRLIADLVRTQQLENAPAAAIKTKAKTMFADISRNLAGAILEAWQNGVVGSSAMKLTIKGQLNPKQLNDFKTEFLHAVRDVKTLKERRFESGQVTFEGDTSSVLQTVADHVKAAQLPGFEIQLIGQGANDLTISVHQRR